MILKNKHLIFSLLLIFVLLITCSCKSEGDISDTEGSREFPVAPDKIVIGANGIERELFYNDEEYSELVSYIEERVAKSGGFLVAPLAVIDPESGKHLSYELRENEIFVEFVYNKCQPQSVPMNRSGGIIEAEEYNVQRVFFSLTRDYHDCFFIGADDDYVNSTTLGVLVDKTELITYVRDLVTQEATSEQKSS